MIIFSLTAHENVECLCDLLINIKKCFVHYNILILLSITENLNDEKLKTYDFVRCVTIRENNLNIWGNIELFQQHILNMKYIYDNSINYDYFWMVSSNELFIKIISPDFLNNYAIKIVDNKQQIEIDYDDYFINKVNNWEWYVMAKQDKHFVEYLYRNKFLLRASCHEGLVLPSNIVLELFNEYKTNELYEKSTFKNYVMEEIFISTYLTNKYIISNNMSSNDVFPDTFCFRYKYTLGNDASYEIIEKNLKCHHVSIKPVIRNYNNSMRLYIRNNII
jgi:hypothetical protein